MLNKKRKAEGGNYKEDKEISNETRMQTPQLRALAGAGKKHDSHREPREKRIKTSRAPEQMETPTNPGRMKGLHRREFRRQGG